MVSRAWKRMADDDIRFALFVRAAYWQKMHKVWLGPCRCLKRSGCANQSARWSWRTQQMVQEQQLNQPQNHNSPPVPQTTVTVTPQPQSQEPPKKKRKTRPWKEVYAERYVVEANWRGGRHRSARVFAHQSRALPSVRWTIPHLRHQHWDRLSLGHWNRQACAQAVGPRGPN